MTSQDAVPPREAKQILILIADDEEPIVELLATFVADLGYTPLVAQNEQQALDLAHERWPALIVTDLILTLREEAAAQGKFSPPIVLLTAGSRRAADHLPVEAELLKPF